MNLGGMWKYAVLADFKVPSRYLLRGGSLSLECVMPVLLGSGPYLGHEATSPVTSIETLISGEHLRAGCY